MGAAVAAGAAMEARVRGLVERLGRAAALREVAAACGGDCEGVAGEVARLVGDGVLATAVLGAGEGRVTLVWPAERREAQAAVQPADDKAQQELIRHLHDYNHVKDVTTDVLGRLAELQNLRTADLYAQYELSLDD